VKFRRVNRELFQFREFQTQLPGPYAPLMDYAGICLSCPILRH
jgi:hypothetical protein